MGYEIAQARAGETADFAFFGKVSEFITCHDPEVVLHGPAECLAEDTVLDCAMTGERLAIADWAAQQRAPVVNTKLGGISAGIPFAKARGSLYRVMFDDENCFTASAGHLIWTARGWRPVAFLRRNDVLLPEYAASRPQSSWEPAPGVSRQGGLGCWHTPRYCQGRCSQGYHQDDVRLLPYITPGPASVQQLGDVPEHIHENRQGDALAFSQGCIPVYQSYAHPSSGDCIPDRGAVPEGVCQPPKEQGGHWPCDNEGGAQFQTWKHSFAPTQLPAAGCELHRSVSVASRESPFVCYYTGLQKQVKSVEYAGEGWYFDLTVPVANHYLLQGVLHHNTGKTFGALFKLHICACKYPRASLVIVRKTQTSVYPTVLRTFIDKILSKPPWPCEVYGGEKPEWFQYVNGSRIWVTGLDKASKVLSAEHDIIYVNQAEELSLDDWETLTTRTTGRAGHMPYSQTIGDANPAYPQHWLYNRPSLTLIYSTHRDNPRLYDQVSGELTEQGTRTMSVLGALTGVRRLRLLDGKPAQAEGGIYTEWSDAVHLIYREQLPAMRYYLASQDWGYTHPGVLGVWGVDGDGRIYLIVQVYKTRQTIDWWIAQAAALHDEHHFVKVLCDPSEPAYVEQYRRAGLPAIAAVNAVLPGINAVKERLALAGDGKPRLYVVQDSLHEIDADLRDAQQPYCLEQELPGYVWADNRLREQPIKMHDDAMDMMRYAALYLATPQRAPLPPVRVRIRSM